MSVFEKFVNVFEVTSNVPKSYGLYHILCVLLTVSLCIFLVWRFKDASVRTVRYLALGFWILMVVLEILKQLEGAFFLQNGVPTWEYDWHSFPFQFCSTPLYVLPLIVFLRDGWLRRSVMAFFACFSLFAGLVVMIYPGDVFCNTLYLNIQTMIHHGLMVALGVLLVARNRNHMNKRYFGGSMMMFYFFVLIALSLNELVYAVHLKDLSQHTFNMFFISRHYPCTLPLLSEIYKAVSYGWFLVIYIAGFTLAAAVIYTLEKALITLSGKGRKKHA